MCNGPIIYSPVQDHSFFEVIRVQLKIAAMHFKCKRLTILTASRVHGRYVLVVPTDFIPDFSFNYNTEYIVDHKNYHTHRHITTMG
jgi:hypothetical protein